MHRHEVKNVVLTVMLVLMLSELNTITRFAPSYLKMIEIKIIPLIKDVSFNTLNVN